MGSMSNYFSSRFSNKILLERICSSCCPAHGRSVPCSCNAQCECSAGDCAGKTASRKQIIGVRFSAIQSDGRVESDMINAVIGLSSWLLESWGGCTGGREEITVPESSVCVLHAALTLHLLFCHKEKQSKINREAFLTCSMLCLNEQQQTCTLTLGLKNFQMANQWNWDPQRQWDLHPLGHSNTQVQA